MTNLTFKTADDFKQSPGLVLNDEYLLISTQPKPITTFEQQKSLNVINEDNIAEKDPNSLLLE